MQKGEISKTKTIKSQNLDGESRVYTVVLMSAKKGFEVFHEFVHEMQLAMPMIIEHMDKLKESGEQINVDQLPRAALEIIQFFPLVFDWARLCELNELMLAGATVETDSGKITFDAQGFATVDPVESYLALLHAIVANYEPLIPPLLKALVVKEAEGSDQGNEKQTLKDHHEKSKTA